MKPTPSGLKERFIIPILREVAEAVKWVHQAGIIHRDLKCANILITEDGGVQLCDFGVAGIIETAVDKRSTFIGTPHWMAPELFQGSHYGKEVDIWAFGSMTYEMATGLPPSAMSGVGGMDLGQYLKSHIPRLEGGKYSDGLRSIVAFCLEERPSDRPTIENVQRHEYIYNTSSIYPTSSLSELVRAFKMWENHGGIRKSLFMAGGAQGPSDSTVLSDGDWNFSTTDAFELAVEQDTNARDVINVYGPSGAHNNDFMEETSRPSRQQESRSNRRRPPPEALAPLRGPLEKLFDPNTISNYQENSRAHYNQNQQPMASDLPLRDDSNQTSIRDTMIDLDAYIVPTGSSSFSDVDTIKADRRLPTYSDDEYDFKHPTTSDTSGKTNRRTQDWKFPSMSEGYANPHVNRFPDSYGSQRPEVTPAVGGRPALVHHPTEPISLPTQSNLMPIASAPSSPKRFSLIDLDLSLPEPSRPSTAGSTTSQDMTSADPFQLERHASLYQPSLPSTREPSLYISDESALGLHLRPGNTLQDLADVSDFSASDAEGTYYGNRNGHRSYKEQTRGTTGYVSSDQEGLLDPHGSRSNQPQTRSNRPFNMNHFPALPPPPSIAALSGTASSQEMTDELQRMLGGMTSQLEAFADVYKTLPKSQRGGGHRDGYVEG